MGRSKLSLRARRARAGRAFPFRPYLQQLEDRTVPTNGQWLAVFDGLTPGADLDEQAQVGRDLLTSSGVQAEEATIARAFDLSGSFLVQTPVDVSQEALTSRLQGVPGF